MAKYDVTIIGSGPCGYVAAIWAARCGLKAAVCEKDLLGGTCLNWGCIPTKTILHTAELFSDIKDAAKYGIDVNPPVLKFDKVFERKERVVEQLRGGIASLFKARKIDLFKGAAALLDKHTVAVGNEKIDSENILLAAGSRPQEIPLFRFDKEYILSSDDMMSLKNLPESLLIVGGGAIGCEFGSIYNAFGKKVVIVEMMDTLLPLLDEEIGKKLELIFKRKGIDVATKTKVEKIDKKEGRLEAMLSSGKAYTVDKALVSVGRRFNSDGLGLEKLNIKVDKGAVVTDDYLRTNVPNIYAGGDIIGGVLLAHVASHEGIAAINNMRGESKKIDYSAVPNCIFTNPEIATVGLSEKDAKSKFKDVKVSRFPYTALGKACAIGKTEGFVKIIGDSSTEKILGVHIMGPHATDLIGEATLAVKEGLKVSSLIETIHAHPTLTEAVHEAALGFYNKSIHLI